jgi:hypothetical protein
MSAFSCVNKGAETQGDCGNFAAFEMAANLTPTRSCPAVSR